MSTSYQPLPLSHSFPKIAVVCGAHTELGQHVLRELIYSAEIEKVYAIASKRIPIMSNFERSVARKATVLTTASDNLRDALDRIPEADLAFCALGTERHAQNTVGMTRFRVYNYEAPCKFVKGMFQLGVLYIAVLSHRDANKDARSELFRARGELQSYIRKLRSEASDFSPFISMFKVSNIVKHHSAPSSSSGHSSRRDDTLEFNEVATAMKVDALSKSAKRRLSATRGPKYEEYYVREVLRLSREGRYGRDDDNEDTPFWHD